MTTMTTTGIRKFTCSAYGELQWIDSPPSPPREPLVLKPPIKRIHRRAASAPFQKTLSCIVEETPMLCGSGNGSSTRPTISPLPDNGDRRRSVSLPATLVHASPSPASITVAQTAHHAQPKIILLGSVSRPGKRALPDGLRILPNMLPPLSDFPMSPGSEVAGWFNNGPPSPESPGPHTPTSPTLALLPMPQGVSRGDPDVPAGIEEDKLPFDGFELPLHPWSTTLEEPPHTPTRSTWHASTEASSPPFTPPAQIRRAAPHPQPQPQPQAEPVLEPTRNTPPRSSSLRAKTTTRSPARPWSISPQSTSPPTPAVLKDKPRPWSIDPPSIGRARGRAKDADIFRVGPSTVTLAVEAIQSADTKAFTAMMAALKGSAPVGQPVSA